MNVAPKLGSGKQRCVQYNIRPFLYLTQHLPLLTDSTVERVTSSHQRMWTTGNLVAVNQLFSRCIQEQNLVADMLPIQLCQRVQQFLECILSPMLLRRPLASMTSATRSIEDDSGPILPRCAIFGIRDGGILSIQYTPTSSSASTAADFPAPDIPVTIINRIKILPFSGLRQEPYFHLQLKARLFFYTFLYLTRKLQYILTGCSPILTTKPVCFVLTCAPPTLKPRRPHWSIS